jgi:hypothetical protein
LNTEIRRKVKCHEEMEQAQEGKALEQAEGWDEAAVDAAYVAALLRARVETVFAQAVVNDFPTKPEPLALSKNAPSAGPP